jgi:two-component system, OmpR family, KDP operon response regulator KdpE
LVVDDDPTTLQALSFKLKSRGYQVLTARDGSQALQATRRNRPDLMLLDVNLPPDAGGADWDGFVVAQWLQRMEEARNMPIIVMSAADRSEYKDRAFASGATAFFCKLTDNDQLLASIDTALCEKTAPRRNSQRRVYEI